MKNEDTAWSLLGLISAIALVVISFLFLAGCSQEASQVKETEQERYEKFTPMIEYIYSQKLIKVYRNESDELVEYTYYARTEEEEEEGLIHEEEYNYYKSQGVTDRGVIKTTINRYGKGKYPLKLWDVQEYEGNVSLDRIDNEVYFEGD
ncbi:hypothetical protein [Listeria phage LMTA-148]|uniref:Uncharacterized protein n=2 Tax=Pecentumvirus TaxID=1857844 RepID=A0A068CFY2_9CAUD|nr:hypothetical protein AG2_149 [Listeria phage vB_LmoM_AG20]YP_009055757.1 hypothetical protein LD12_gp075 [Listeria phage LMTA-148]AFJ76084.1 hypothetical protein AG2_149 [Listeria phage vB_LmoM_AG20]AID17446.1 hypothetical protein [Listeria phage LMTA-148]WIW77384.1 hypothetical protein CKA15_173 [Listeria phage cka15]